MNHDTPKSIVITVCKNCRLAGTDRENAPGKQLLAFVQSAASGQPNVIVRSTECLSVCNRVCSVSLSGDGAYTFVFGDLDAANDAEAIVSMAAACAVAPYGFIPWKQRPEALRKGTVARIAPPSWSPEDGSAPA
jgi:predicted metal-binding protein